MCKQVDLLSVIAFVTVEGTYAAVMLHGKVRSLGESLSQPIKHVSSPKYLCDTPGSLPYHFTLAEHHGVGIVHYISIV
jgi:hypothetical protein